MSSTGCGVDRDNHWAGAPHPGQFFAKVSGACEWLAESCCVEANAC